MSAIASLRIIQSVLDSNGVETMPADETYRWAPATTSIKREVVSLTGSASTTLTVPTNAKKVRIVLPASAVSITLKGNAADTGIPISPSSNFIGGTTELTLGSSPVIILANDSATAREATIWWL